MAWVWKLKIPSTAKLVLLALADHADDEGHSCYPSLSRLGSKCSLDRSTIVRAIDKLVILGIVERAGVSDRGTTLYRVNFNGGARAATGGAAQSVALCGSPRRTVQPQVVAQSDTKPSIEPSLNRQTHSASPEIALKASDSVHTQGTTTLMDPAYEHFAEKFRIHRKIPYRRNQKNDFIQLSALRRQMALPRCTTPLSWDTAVENYLGSPLSKYTLADLCARFDVFIAGGVDRYGKPNGSNQQHNNNTQTATLGSTSARKTSRGDPIYVPNQ